MVRAGVVLRLFQKILAMQIGRWKPEDCPTKVTAAPSSQVVLRMTGDNASIALSPRLANRYCCTALTAVIFPNGAKTLGLQEGKESVQTSDPYGFSPRSGGKAEKQEIWDPV